MDPNMGKMMISSINLPNCGVVPKLLDKSWWFKHLEHTVWRHRIFWQSMRSLDAGNSRVDRGFWLSVPQVPRNDRYVLGISQGNSSGNDGCLWGILPPTKLWPQCQIFPEDVMPLLCWSEARICSHRWCWPCMPRIQHDRQQSSTLQSCFRQVQDSG